MHSNFSNKVVSKSKQIKLPNNENSRKLSNKQFNFVNKQKAFETELSFVEILSFKRLILHEMHFLQYYSLLFNCEKQYLKLINLELYEVISIECAWRDKKNIASLSLWYCYAQEYSFQIPVEVDHQQEKRDKEYKNKTSI